MKLLFTFSAAFFFCLFVASRNLSPARCFDKKALAAEIFAISCLCHGEGMCGEVRSEPTIPNTASSLSACYVCASYASAVYLQRKRHWLFYLPFKNVPDTKDPTPSGVATRPACLSVCGGNGSWHTEGNMRGRTEGGSQATHCPELTIQRDKIHGDTQWERNSPSKFKRLQMCAWPRLLLHTSGPGKLPRTPPRPRPPSRLLFITLPSALPWKSNQGREHTAGVSCHSPGRLVRQLRRIRGRTVHHERALKRPLSWRLGGEIWRRGKFGGFQKGEVQPFSNSATGGQQ